MQQQKQLVMSWSGGKDAALALQLILQEGIYDVGALFTLLDKKVQRSTVHSIPLEILERQARQMGIPLVTAYVADDLNDFTKVMTTMIQAFSLQGVTHIGYGDIFLEDTRSYREALLHPWNIEWVAPLWQRSSQEIMEWYFHSGLHAKIIVTQADKLDQTFIGEELTAGLIRRFPANVDICGERGEYHTLVYAGEIFTSPIKFEIQGTKKISQSIGLTNGQTKIFHYWQADIGVSSDEDTPPGD